MPELAGRQPDAVLACVGGGSNARGIVYDYIAHDGVRLIGVSVSNFTDDGEQMALFAPTNAGIEAAAIVAVDPEIERELTGTIDAIRAKFGTAAVGPATLAEGGKLRVKRQGDTQWGPNET